MNRALPPFLLAFLIWWPSSARADLPRIDESVLTIGAKKFTIGVPAGWRCKGSADGDVAQIDVFGPAGEALVVLIRPATPEAPALRRKELAEWPAAIAKLGGFEPVGAAHQDALAGWEAHTVYARRTVEGVPVSGFVSALDTPNRRTLIVAQAPTARFREVEVLLRLAAHALALPGPPPPKPCRPVVLGPAPAPGETIEGSFWQRELELELNVATNTQEYVSRETVYTFSREGFVYRDFADPGVPFDAARTAAFWPASVGTYEAKKDGPLALRFPGAAAIVFDRWKRAPAALELGGALYAQADLDLSAVKLEGRYASEATTRMRGGAKIAIERTLRFAADGRFEQTGAGFFSDPTVIARSGTNARRGTYRLGRGAIVLEYEDGTAVPLWIRLNGEVGGKDALDLLLIGGEVYRRQ